MERKILQLPPQHDGTRHEIDVTRGQVIIIGANGAGKTRFADYMLHEHRDNALKLTALDAVAPQEGEGGNFGRLIKRLMHDEMLSLIDFKLKLADNPQARPQPTRLDRVIAMWRRVFPGNRILIESGELLFARDVDGDDGDTYSSVRLSAGERTVLYYLAAVVYAPQGAMVFVDNSAMFLHPSLLSTLWDMIEDARPDCTFVYTTHDLDFVSTRNRCATVWVRDCDPSASTWDYDVLPPDSGLSDDIYLAILGARKHVLFIEGDGINSIDAKLYPLIFKDFTVKSLGSCNKVIEATRTFNDLASFHHLDSHGIVDRDRRDEGEVRYLRDRKIFVPEVAEIENILMLEEVIRAVASARGHDEDRAFHKVKSAVLSQFDHDLRRQALLHTRHRVKRTMEYRIDGRFANIGMLEQHINDLVKELNARGLYEQFCRDFRALLQEGDYAGVLRVYNQKSMLPASNVAGVCGLANKNEYINAILDLLRHDGPAAERIRRAVIHCFNLDEQAPLAAHASGSLRLRRKKRH